MRSKKVLPLREIRVLIAQDEQGAVLLEKRPPQGIWGGLWSFPEMGDSESELECLQRLGMAVSATTRTLPTYRHTFTHFKLDIVPIKVEVGPTATNVMEDGQRLWYNSASPTSIGLTQPVQALIETARQDEESNT